MFNVSNHMGPSSYDGFHDQDSGEACWDSQTKKHFLGSKWPVLVFIQGTESVCQRHDYKLTFVVAFPHPHPNSQDGIYGQADGYEIVIQLWRDNSLGKGLNLC